MSRDLSTLILLGICSIPCNANEAAADTAAEHDVLQVQSIRFTAMTENDLETLDSTLSEDLSYTHTTGRIETKTEFLSSLRSRSIAYHSIEPTDVQVRIYDSSAVVTGISSMKVSARDNNLAFSMRFIEVYNMNEGKWQLVAWQSTLLPEQ